MLGQSWLLFFFVRRLISHNYMSKMMNGWIINYCLKCTHWVGKIKWIRDISYGKIIMASKCIYRVTHLVMGKTISKKALSCVRTQRCKSQVRTESDEAQQAWTCVRARNLRTWMSDQNWVQNLSNFSILFFKKISNNVVTKFNNKIKLAKLL